jgi:hypothetical protein
MNFINYLLFALFLPFVHSSDTMSKTLVLNPDEPNVRYNDEERKLYCGENNYSLPMTKEFEDIRWIGEKDNISVIRSIENGCVTFSFMCGEVLKDAVSTSRSYSKYQKILVGGWGVHLFNNKIFVAWLEYLITSYDPAISIDALSRVDLLEEVRKKQYQFRIVAYLKLWDIFVNSGFASNAIKSIEINNVQLNFGIRPFPDLVLFSPDGMSVIVKGESGFVVKPLIPIYSSLVENEAEIFDFPPIDTTTKVWQTCAIKWISSEAFWVLYYTNLVTKFVTYFKSDFKWWKEDQSKTLIEKINKEIRSVEFPTKLLLRLRFGSPRNDDKKVPLFGFFLGLRCEQLIENIPTY